MYQELTRSRGKNYDNVLDTLLPACKATALPCQSITGEPLDPTLVLDVACNANLNKHILWQSSKAIVFNWEEFGSAMVFSVEDVSLVYFNFSDLLWF
jgi:hypothetical protein